jgi:hypothetical protein
VAKFSGCSISNKGSTYTLNGKADGIISPNSNVVCIENPGGQGC